ncbi:unannotated protein [freshwater metagenome]|uniref:Unannotated protein n=1 Tax=freshwater metagenome TaxID=449393 RepID=A0A6J7MYW4_9ZZZZ
MLGKRVRREQLLGLLDSDGCRHDRAVDLVLHVAAQIPREGLEPAHRIGRGPRFRLVVRVLQAEDGVLQAQFRPAMLGEIGVDADGIRVEDATRPRGEHRQLLLRDPAPPEGPQEGVGRHLALAEHLGEPAGGDVPANVHLPEAVLRMRVALCREQVLEALGIDLRDPEVVTNDGDGRLQPSDGQGAGGDRERRSNGVHAEEDGAAQAEEEDKAQHSQHSQPHSHVLTVGISGRSRSTSSKLP